MSGCRPRSSAKPTTIAVTETMAIRPTVPQRGERQNHAATPIVVALIPAANAVADCDPISRIRQATQPTNAIIRRLREPVNMRIENVMMAKTIAAARLFFS